VHCFDSFEGLTAFSSADGQARSSEGAYRGNLEELRQMIELYELGDDVDIHEGLIETTLPAFLAQRPEVSFSFVYCDTDLYASTKTILESIHPRLTLGGVFVLDEWNYESYPGETVAVREFTAAHSTEYEMLHVPGTRQPSLVLKRVR
jgi:predicted O-methyltransferase YrrM